MPYLAEWRCLLTGQCLDTSLLNYRFWEGDFEWTMLKTMDVFLTLLTHIISNPPPHFHASTYAGNPSFHVFPQAHVIRYTFTQTYARARVHTQSCNFTEMLSHYIHCHIKERKKKAVPLVVSSAGFSGNHYWRSSLEPTVLVLSIITSGIKFLIKAARMVPLFFTWILALFKYSSAKSHD